MTAAAVWYEQQARGLGGAFLDRIEQAVEFVRTNPKACAADEDGFRCKLLRQFPFGLVYSIDADETVVLAVMHLHRKPDYWKDR